MRRKLFTRAAALIMSVFVAFGMLAVFAEKPEAKTVTDIYPTVLFVGQEANVNVSQWNDKTGDGKELEVISVSTKDKSLVKIHKESWKDGGKTHRMFYLTGKKAGTAKLKITYKKAGGKKVTTTSKLKVKKYPNPVKSLKVAGKTVNISKNKFIYYRENYKKTNPAIKMSLKKGWKIVDAYGFYYNKSGDGKNLKIKSLKSKILNGKTLSFPSKYVEMQVTAVLSDGKDYMEYTTFISRR